jgi:hypothetical protein
MVKFFSQVANVMIANVTNFDRHCHREFIYSKKIYSES